MSKIKKILNILFEKEEIYTSTIKELEAEKKISKGYNYGNIKKSKEKKDEYLTATEISKHFDIRANTLNQIFLKLQWTKQEERWWLITELGKNNGAKQYYDTKNKVKYLRWEERVKNNFQLIKAIEEFKKVRPQSNKEKGDKYESFIAEHYKDLGYFVWEHGKERGRLDQGIDLIVKKDKEIIFIQCKNWKQNTRFKIDHVRIKASRAEARQFMLNNPLFKGYDNKFRYTISSNCMHTSAIKYIEETNGLFDYEIIEMKL